MEKLLYSIDEAAAATGLGRTTIYSHVNAGHLPVVKIGRRTCITAEALKEFTNKDWPISTVYRNPK